MHLRGLGAKLPPTGFQRPGGLWPPAGSGNRRFLPFSKEKAQASNVTAFPLLIFLFMEKAGKRKPLFYEGQGQISTHKAAFTQGGLLAFLCMGEGCFSRRRWDEASLCCSFPAPISHRFPESFPFPGRRPEGQGKRTGAFQPLAWNFLLPTKIRLTKGN